MAVEDPRIDEVKLAILSELRHTIPPSIDLMRDTRFERAAKRAVEICDRYSKKEVEVTSTHDIERTLIGNTDAKAWAEEFCALMIRLSPVDRSSIVIDEGNMIGWFANAIMSGYDEGQRVEQKKDIAERLQAVIFQAAGAAAGVCLRDTDVFPTERVAEAVNKICEDHGIPRRD